MDNEIFRRHLRISRAKFERLNARLSQVDARQPHRIQVPVHIRTAMFLWYMSNQNSFREISDKLNVAISTAHACIAETLKQVCNIAEDYISWPNQREKESSAAVFKRITGIDNVIGAIDGCHIRIQKPPGGRGDD